MRLTAFTTLFLATLTLANPIAEPAPTAALTPASLAPEIDGRAAVLLTDRASSSSSKSSSSSSSKASKAKPKGGKGNNTEEEGAASGMLAPSRVLELGALSLGVMEVVRLWA
jgi:hypothetical protein